ncbi:nucleoside triphosphate pyrophosphohydrolase [Mycobacterium noviomagense]|uniref:Phosphoribosyl-ATP pyrophosphohydrolase n=1 Tax=Mycobacterium noviomagense TaxID=459858 RepID=A0A7I7PF24_9MYCO|nr:nucleoside triphosphate pyrophosphohydrolase [Mycobacterium noviomagense]ORB12689.1 phosphoribosyl-ATP pyrophosphohydrolase [Mycobacterium noviomagense]BBY07109.1 hypothetical protein MNVI_24270 [Mycobacterium noviomagense]
MGKLVRDKVPDLIRASGRTPHVKTLRPGQYREALHDKLREEVDELFAASTPEAVIDEAADIVEVLTAIAGDQGASFGSILDAAQRKRSERGGFGKRLWLESIQP